MTLNPPVEGEREVVIYDPIYVVPAILVFPWIPVSGEYYKYQLKVNEGEHSCEFCAGHGLQGGVFFILQHW